jgi:hypothetical protein
MISMSAYMQKRISDAKELNYTLWLRICGLCWWASLAKGRGFLTKDGEVVQNLAGNGALRVLLGGFIAMLAALFIMLRALINIVFLLIGLPLIPLFALGFHIWTNRKLAKSLRDFEAKVAAARSGVKP